jgi:hypothetical protein
MSSSKSVAEKLLKEHFNSKQELSKELKLYQYLINEKYNSESKAEQFINTILEARKKIDEKKLTKEKYNLIKEIKRSYDIDNFFKAKIDNYKIYAAIYTIFESNQNKEIDTKQILLNKINILEHITEGGIENKTASATIVEEFMKEDKEVRLLAYKIMVEKFNSKYSNLSDRQKSVLKEYINNISETENLKKYLNKVILEVKTELTDISKTIKDPVTKIKLSETIKLISPIKSNGFVKDEHISAVLQYMELIDELKNNR